MKAGEDLLIEYLYVDDLSVDYLSGCVQLPNVKNSVNTSTRTIRKEWELFIPNL